MKNLLIKNNIILYLAGLVVVGGLLLLYLTTAPVSYNSLNQFDFSLNYGVHGVGGVNTYDNTLTKDLVLDGSETIRFLLPDKVMKKAYNIMREIDIMNYPDSIDTGEKGIPSEYYKLVVTINDETRTIRWEHGILPFDSGDSGLYTTRDQKDFLRLVKYIRDYIVNTVEFKSMPQARGGYF